MLRRNIYFLIVLGAFLTFSIYLYNGIDTRNLNAARNQEDLEKLRSDIKKLQSEIKGNEETIKTLKSDVGEAERKRKIIIEQKEALAKEEEEQKKLKKSQEEQQKNVVAEPKLEQSVEAELHGNKVAEVRNVLQRTTPKMTNVCLLKSNLTEQNSEMQMLDLYDIWKFDNPDGGVWKQGWPITYDEKNVLNEDKLEVIVIPHSHCDPGWIKTFEEYYAQQTKNILDGMAKHLEIKDEMRFIYAEMSFFELWWRDQTEETRQKVKEYIKRGKFEIVTGGWVMTDEANAHYHSMVVELMEGHEWIKNHLGEDARPKSHWSIDPFGLSPTVPHLLSAANITNAALQRVHYVVKRELAKAKKLEFMWRQLFAPDGSSDIRAHVFPFFSYDIPHTCGPEPKICCQFDFRRQPAGGMHCDWNVPPQTITEKNVAYRAQMIYDQYRKKSQLYKTNVLLIPLGDDFRYDIDFEWEEQYRNYKKLFEYMNQKKEWNVNAKFGTLSDYFSTLDASLKKSGDKLPTLSGDFFTYADRDDHYWSGYFTSRPFYKQLDRVLQHYLRSAEIAFTLSSIEDDGAVETELFNKLITARRALSLFQHHDGVTGTAKDAVVVDYGNKMLEALRACEDVLSESLTVVLGFDSVKKMLLDEERKEQDVLPQRRIYKFGQSVVVFNTLTRERTEPVCIFVDSFDLSVAHTDVEIPQQISPVFELDADSKLVIKTGVFEICFKSVLSPLEAASYEIVPGKTIAMEATIKGKEKISIDNFDFVAIESDEFSVQNSKVKANFDAFTGLLKSLTPMTIVETRPIEVNAHFVHYGVRPIQKFTNGGTDYPSGAYLFLPDGPAKTVSVEDHTYVVVDGPLVKHVYVAGNKDLKVLQTYSLMEGSHFIDIDTEIDIRSKRDFELALRFDTNVDSASDFFTDLNGLQMIRRRRHDNMPLQANFFPMSSAFIEDVQTRFTVHGAQALGVASLKSGQLEIMLDRRLTTDDGRGVMQGVLDNKRTVSHLRLLAEPMHKQEYDDKARIGFHSAVSHFASWTLHYPIVRMIADVKSKSVNTKVLEGSLNCDMHLVTMRTVAGPTDYPSTNRFAQPLREASIVLHRAVSDCRSRLVIDDSKCSAQSYTITPSTLLPTLKETHSTSLTSLYEGEMIKDFEVPPHQVKSVKIKW